MSDIERTAPGLFSSDFMDTAEMPTERLARTRQNVDSNNGRKGSTTATDRTDSGRAPRARHAPKSDAAGDHPSSNGTDLPRRRTLTQAMSADSSPTKASSNRPPSNRRVKDFVSIHEELTKRSTGRPTVVKNGNEFERRPPSRSRLPAELPAVSKSSAQESLKNPSVSEITELSPSRRKDDPALEYEDHVSTNYVQNQMDRKASSKDINRRPPSGDTQVETDKYEDVRRVKQNGLRKSNSLDKRPTGDRKSSPAAPNRRHSQTSSQTRSSSSGPGRTEQPETTSSSADSRQAERRPLGGNNGIKPYLKQEAPKRSSPSSRAGKSKPSSSDGFLDFQFTEESALPPTKSSSPDVSQDSEEPANSAMQSYAQHEGANGFKGEIETGAGGRLYRRKRSSGGKSTQEDATDLATGPMRRSQIGKRNNSKQDNGYHIPVTRHESNGNLKQEDQADSGGQGSTGGNFKQDNAANSVATGLSEGTTNNKTLDIVKYRPGTASVRRNRNVKWLLTGVAAASYNGGWLPYDEMVPFPPDIANLNQFLNNCRYEVEAGIPGRFLTVVLGNEISDLDSIVSTITYAYFLSSIGGLEESKVFVPVINMRQEDLVLHTEAVWLFKVTGLDTSNLLFVDQISLQYYHRFGNLNLVLVDHSRLAAHQETLQDAVMEIVDHNLIDELYSWVVTKDIQQVGSCCTIIAERFAAEAPERLTGRGLNRLLLGPILLDTANLDPKSARCTARDMCMAAFLINGAGRYGQQGFYRLLRKKKFDISTLSTIEMMRKDLKRWSLGPGKTDTYGLKGRVISAAMSTLGVPLKEIMTRKGILQDLRFFGRKLKLDLHLIVTGYYDNTDRYKRELLLVPGEIELRDHLRTCFRPHKSDLQLSYMLIPGLPDDMLVYKQGMVTASRNILRQILKDYFEM